jgi:hypothetical protein
VRKQALSRIVALIAVCSIPLTWPALAQTKTVDAGLAKELIDLAVGGVINDGDPEWPKRIGSILDEHGVPTVSQVGDQASYAFVAATIYPDETGYEHKVWDLLLRHQAEYPQDAIEFYRARMKILTAAERVKRDGLKEPELQETIEKIIPEDQSVRKSMASILADGGNAMRAMDERHAAAVEQILKTHGVPTFTMVGPAAASDFVVLIQHQTARLRDMALPQLRANVEKGEGDGHYLALLVDRSLNDHGKPQYYGTQMDCVEGKAILKPIEPLAGVDERRAHLGVIRMSLYEQIGNKLCQ